MDAEDVHRSVVQWALGGTLIPIELVAVPIVFLGRDELAAAAEPIANPLMLATELMRQTSVLVLGTRCPKPRHRWRFS